MQSVFVSLLVIDSLNTQCSNMSQTANTENDPAFPFYPTQCLSESGCPGQSSHAEERCSCDDYNARRYGKGTYDVLQGPLGFKGNLLHQRLITSAPSLSWWSVFRRQHHDFEQLDRPTRISKQTYPSVLIHIQKPICLLRLSLRNTINMTVQPSAEVIHDVLLLKWKF